MKKILLLMLALVAIGSVARAEEFFTIPEHFYRLYPEFLVNNESEVYTEEDNEEFIPVSFTIYNEEFNVVKTIKHTPIRYDYKVETFYGEVFEDRIFSEIFSVDLFGETSYISDAATFTQTLFNDDELYEYIRPLYEQRSYTQEYSDNYYEKYTNKPVRVGFEIVNENNEVLQTVKFPTEYEGGDDPELLLMGSKYYLMFEVYKDDISLVYPIKKGTNSIQAPKIIKGSAKVHPTKVKSSEAVNVTFDQMLERSCNIEVVSLNGSVVYRTVAQAGSESAQINTSRLASGIYVVNIHDGKEIKENCKIIIR